jgi:hypothetical protein
VIADAADREAELHLAGSRHPHPQRKLTLRHDASATDQLRN